MKIYTHTQVGTLILVALGGSIFLTGTLLFLTPAEPVVVAILASVLAALLIALLLFWGLKVEVSEEQLLVSFGPGLIRRRIAIADIEDVRRVRNKWIYGWGIRWIPHGWMFNISGLDAVELQFPGGRRFRIGTDDPQGLFEALLAACRSTQQTGDSHRD